MKTDLEMTRELNALDIQIYKIKGTERFETCTHDSYRLEFDSIKDAYDYHKATNFLNKEPTANVKKFKLVITSVFHFHVEIFVDDEIFCCSDRNIYKSEIIKAIKEYEAEGFVLVEYF